MSSTYLTLEATEQVTSPTSSSNINTASTSTPAAKYTKVIEIRSDHDIRHFRRNLPKLIAAMVKPNASVPPQVDIFFKRAPTVSVPLKSSSAGAEVKSSKSGFEAKVKECLASGQPLKVTYTLREAEAKVKNAASELSSKSSTTPAASVSSTTTTTTSTAKDVAVATPNGPTHASSTAPSTSGLTDAANAKKGSPADYTRLSLELTALMTKQLHESNKKRDEAEVKVGLARKELHESKKAQEATAALLEASQARVDRLAKALADLEKEIAEKAPLPGSEKAVADKAELQVKASSIVDGMKDFLAAYAKVSRQSDTCGRRTSYADFVPFLLQLQLLGPDEQELSPSTNDEVQKQQERLTTKSPVKPPQKDGALHPDIFCDGACDAAVRGLRWKCIACMNFDFCDSCYQSEREAHVEKHGAKHLFLAIHDPVQSGLVRSFGDRFARYAPARSRKAPPSEQASSSAKPSGQRKEPAVVKASAAPQTIQTSAMKQNNISVQLLPEPIPVSSELTPAEKSFVTREIVNANASIGPKLKELLQNQQQIPENARQTGEFVVDVDYLTRSQFRQIMALFHLDNVSPRTTVPAQVWKDVIASPLKEKTSTSHAEDDAEDEKMPYDCTLTWNDDGNVIVAVNTGSCAWRKKSLSLTKSTAGSAWVDARALILDGQVRTKCLDFVQPGEQVWIWRKIEAPRATQGCTDKGTKDVFFKMAITFPNGKCQRFGEQLMVPAPAPAPAVDEASSGPATGASDAFPSSSEKGKAPEAAVEETASGAGKSLSGSSILTIPAAPEATHTDEEAALAASIPSRPSSREREDEDSRPDDRSTEAGELSSQYTGRTEESTGDALRSPSYEGGSTNSERDPFDSLADEEEVFLDEQDEEEDHFIVIDAGTDEESVVGA
jgi:hypothetical protein